MKSVEDSVREIVEFSEKQLAAEMRRLKKDGGGKKNVKADAYATIINVLSSLLSGKSDDQKDDVQSS